MASREDSGLSPPKWTELNDLASKDVGGRVLFSTDDWFAEAENLLFGSEPIWKEGFTEQGKWMDGWETRRKRIPGHDWCIISLGLPGIIHGVEVRTDFFTGNFAPKFSLQGASLQVNEANLPARIARRGQAATKDQFEGISILKSQDWEELIPMTPLGSGYKDTMRTFVDVTNKSNFTHLRLNIFPDGGVARLRVYGVSVPQVMPKPSETMDLMSATLGGMCIGYSNAHYGHPRNMIRPDDGKDMGDGWETARKLDRPSILEADEKGILKVPGSEFAAFKLGLAGRPTSIIIDTNHFKGNYPDSAVVEAKCTALDDTQKILDQNDWQILLPAVKLSPHQKHVYGHQDLNDVGKVTHVRIKMFPDGGISRVRIFGNIAF